MKLIAGIITSAIFLSLFAAQAFAAHGDTDGNKPTINVPSKGAVYAVDVSGLAHMAGTNDYRPVSANLEWTVVTVKTSGIPTFGFELTSGSLNLDGNAYSFDKGMMTIQVHRVLVDARASSGLPILDIFAKLAGPLPKSVSDEPVVLLQGKRERSASVQTIGENWIIEFTGSISRTA